MSKTNPFLDKCFSTVSWRKGYSIPERAQDVAEAAFRELREGDYDDLAFRDTTDKIKNSVKDWLMTDPQHVELWRGVEQ